MSVQGRYCDECKDGFYFFPIKDGDDCQRCRCDLGGAFPQCNKLLGKEAFLFACFKLWQVLCWPSIFGSMKDENNDI